MFTEKKFEDNYIASLGLDFMSKKYQPPDGQEMRVKIWDTGG